MLENFTSVSDQLIIDGIVTPEGQDIEPGSTHDEDDISVIS
ncbi:MAG TPA: hypothetical protein VIR33_02100 [Thermopolyspora sp.]|jgi:hypothetical protein